MVDRRVELLAELINRVWPAFDRLPPVAAAHLIAGLMVKFRKTYPEHADRLDDIIETARNATRESVQ